MKSFTELFSDAYAQYKSANFADAISLLDEAELLFTEPIAAGALSLEDLYVLKGSIFIQLQNLEEGKSEFEKALRLNPYSSEACQGLGKIFYYYGLNDLAKTMLEWSVTNDNSNESARQNLHEVNSLLGLPETHNTLLIPPEQMPERSTNEKLEEAYQQFSSKNYDEALKNLEAIRLDYEEKLASIENFKGFNYLALNELSLAKACFSSALRLNPDSSQGYAGLGEVSFLESKDYEALENFEKAVQMNPSNHFAKAGLDKAKNSIATLPGNNNYHKKLEDTIQEAYSDFSQKNYQESIKKIEKSETIVRHIGLNNLGMATSFKNFKGFNYLALSELDKAKQSFEDALETDPNSSQACAGLAEIYFLINMDKESKTMYELAAKNNPGNSFAISGLAKVNRTLGFSENHTSLN